MKNILPILAVLLLACGAFGQSLGLMYIPYAGTNYHTGTETWPPFVSEGYVTGMTGDELQWPQWQCWRAMDYNLHTLEQAVTNQQPHSANLDLWATTTPSAFQFHAANLDGWSGVATNTVQTHSTVLDLWATTNLNSGGLSNLMGWAAQSVGGYSNSLAGWFTNAQLHGSASFADGAVTLDSSGNISAGGGAVAIGSDGTVTLTGTTTLQGVSFQGSADAPSDTTTPAAWVKVVISGTEYRMPLYSYP